MHDNLGKNIIINLIFEVCQIPGLKIARKIINIKRTVGTSFIYL